MNFNNERNNEMFNINKSRKIKVDYEVYKNIRNLKGMIFGKVTNESGYSIKNAIIKVYDYKGRLIAKTKTDSRGIYFIQKISACRQYRIICFARGYFLSKSIKFCVYRNKIKNINFRLKRDEKYGKSIITGDVFEENSYLAIESAIVVLFKKNDDGEYINTIGQTNEFGQFAFTNLCFGEYIIKVYKDGYLRKNCLVSINKCRQITNIIFLLEKNKEDIKGTVSGMVIDNQNKPVKKADVILYEKVGEKLEPIDFTKTNDEGVYLFFDVSIGNYVVKANKLDFTSIDLSV